MIKLFNLKTGFYVKIHIIQFKIYLVNKYNNLHNITILAIIFKIQRKGKKLLVEVIISKQYRRKGEKTERKKEKNIYSFMVLVVFSIWM